MTRYVLYFLVFLLSYQTMAENKVIDQVYFIPILGHVHQSPLAASASVTAIQCAYPLKVISSSNVKYPDDWLYVEVSDMTGFIKKNFTSKTRPNCFQERYPKFWDAFDFDLTELHFWGKLQDFYIPGEVGMN